MAHPWYHAVMAARKFGGVPDDYLALESWLDYTKSHVADCRHRLFLHNAWGIFLAERVLGVTLIRASDGKRLPTRPLLEDHIVQDFGRIPTLARCLDQLAPEVAEPDITAYEQATQSAVDFGGVWQDYQPLHELLDWPRAYVPDGRHRRILHNTWGLAIADEVFGPAFTRASDGVVLPTRAILAAHIVREYREIPTLEDMLDGITVQRWMCAAALPLRVAQAEEAALELSRTQSS